MNLNNLKYYGSREDFQLSLDMDEVIVLMHLCEFCLDRRDELEEVPVKEAQSLHAATVFLITQAYGHLRRG